MHQLKQSLHHKTLIFLHIQKCAGNSLIDILQGHVPARKTLKGHLLHANAPEIKKPIQNYKLIVGHNTYHDMSLLPVDPVYITMLRDPIERILSLYYFWRSHRWDYIERYDLKGPRLAKQLPLADFIEHEAPEAKLSIRNAQASQFLNGLRGSPELPDHELLRIAKQRLDTCAFVGITERFEPSIDLLCHIFGWQRPDTTRYVNQSSSNERKHPRYEPTKRPPLDETIRKRLVELNGADIPLYAYASDMFNTMWNKLREEQATNGSDMHLAPPLIMYRVRPMLSDFYYRLRSA